jgi:alpha/beta superfamily hydrolase
MAPDAVAVICHPHPLHGGTMTNKVVHMLAKAFNSVGAPAVRFNYRGVGASAGAFDEGNGETQDALAVLDWTAQRWPGAQLWLGGFSFGGGIAIRAAAAREVTRLVTVAPAIRLVSVDTSALPQCPWLVVQGDRDELVDAADIQRWAQSLATPPRVTVLNGVEHFFHGRLNDLRQVVVSWLGELAASQALDR